MIFNFFLSYAMLDFDKEVIIRKALKFIKEN